MVEQKGLFPESETVEDSLVFVGGGDGSMVLDHEIVFVCPLFLFTKVQITETLLTAQW